MGLNLKHKFKGIMPREAALFYHWAIAYLSALIYRFPSRKMIVIGVTGTKGKTITANFIWSVLNQGGITTGLISSAVIGFGKKTWLNKFHMTMPGRFILRRLLAQMAKQGCKYAVIETTSEGIKQSRHKGIAYDIAVFTNLAPEHLSSHKNSFEEYKKAKGVMFEGLRKSFVKKLNGKLVQKIIIANNDDPRSSYFLGFAADKKITFSVKKESDYQAGEINSFLSGTQFRIKEKEYHVKTIGAFNVYNALPAIILGDLFGLCFSNIQKGLDVLKLVPGRMEKIEAGQEFVVLVDYAHEESSMKEALKTSCHLCGENSRIIVLLGAEGGGRDKSKRSAMGMAAGQKADFVIISNIDPYEDDPAEIAQTIANAAEREGKILDKDLFVILDRRQGIRKALSLAQKSDIVLITGKGAEQSITIGGVKHDWDDRVVAKEELNKIIKHE